MTLSDHRCIFSNSAPAPRGPLAVELFCSLSVVAKTPAIRGHQTLRVTALLGRQLSSCTLRPEWTWFVTKGVRSISANVVVLIDRIIVLNDRKISPRPLCNAKRRVSTTLRQVRFSKVDRWWELSGSRLVNPDFAGRSRWFGSASYEALRVTLVSNIEYILALP